MNTLKYFLLLSMFLSVFCVYAQKTEIKMLSGKDAGDNVMWDFYCDGGRKSGKWSKIKVPSCWEQEGFGSYNYGYNKEKSSESGFYRTSFSVPIEWKDRRVFIVFDGSMTDTKVKVNGRKAGDVHQGAFYRFRREITDLIKYGKKNLLEVEVNKMSANESVNSAERDADFWVFGGIYRPVYLEAVPETFIEYCTIDARHDGKIGIQLNMNKKISDPVVNVEVFEAKSSRKVASFSQKLAGNSPRIATESFVSGITAWSAENPYLYDAVVSVERYGKTLHTVKKRFGFRTVEVRPRDGVYVNNRKIRFKGVNRHCFWPTTGRSVTEEQSLEDVRLIKAMNMNAIRMSHYPPDEHLLDMCDSIGLYVIDELCAWQKPPYDTQVGTLLVNEMVKRDQHHPSIIFWANGNEGGFNFDLDTLFVQLDPQKRPVLHPWALHDDINTTHYITYNSGIKNMFNGRDIFMPTELLHGLYDGGMGAGLDDYWNLMFSNPLSAGLFLWDFADQAIVRTDRGGELDTDRDSGADGVVGPYREKEGSFYTIKQIWSPVFIENKYITAAWDGSLNVENRYDFTNLNECSFSYSFMKAHSLDDCTYTSERCIQAPDLAPGDRTILKLDLPVDWREYDFLYLTAKDKYGKEIFTWSYEIAGPESFTRKVLAEQNRKDEITVKENDGRYIVKVAEKSFSFNKSNGLLAEVSNSKGIVPLSNGPVLITDQEMECAGVEMKRTDDAVEISAIYRFKKGGEAYRFIWTVGMNGVLQLDYTYRPQDNVEMAGVTFNYPETDIDGAVMLSNGPYRVYGNRMKGGTINVWDKKYNDAITGEEWNYPEFKGYYSLFYGMRLKSTHPFEIYCASEDVFLRLFTPTMQKKYNPKRNYTYPPYPQGDLSFMDAIPSVGTKFAKAENFGPQSQKHRFKGYSGTPDMKNRLYFLF